jgi:hypothetical protein
VVVWKRIRHFLFFGHSMMISAVDDWLTDFTMAAFDGNTSSKYDQQVLDETPEQLSNAVKEFEKAIISSGDDKAPWAPSESLETGLASRTSFLRSSF